MPHFLFYTGFFCLLTRHLYSLNTAKIRFQIFPSPRVPNSGKCSLKVNDKNCLVMEVFVEEGVEKQSGKTRVRVPGLMTRTWPDLFSLA